ncbi:hypothetical protein BDB01DRAFT_904345 [Pilobolus umbonatus]|nr:hypothetical protein BDB01DRAFT_904345 [Pilobolus umbonatus]
MNILTDNRNNGNNSNNSNNNKRNSMSTYVPVHRRMDSTEQVRWNEEDNNRKNTNKYRSLELTMEPSLSASKRSSINRRSHNRFSRNSFMDDDYDYDKRSVNDYNDNNPYDSDCPPEEWENILRQYDRYGTEDDKINARKSKRASRIMDTYSNENPGKGKGKVVKMMLTSLIMYAVEMPAIDEPTLILDCYDFPSAFKTQHLHDIFRNYESMRGGYKIKWLSDTRALIIFEHPATAKKAYIDNVTHALAKIRPYDGPMDFLKDATNPPQQRNRPMSLDVKRQSFNGYGGRSSNRNSIRE